MKALAAADVTTTLESFPCTRLPFTLSPFPFFLSFCPSSLSTLLFLCSLPLLWSEGSRTCAPIPHVSFFLPSFVAESYYSYISFTLFLPFHIRLPSPNFFVCLPILRLPFSCLHACFITTTFFGSYYLYRTLSLLSYDGRTTPGVSDIRFPHTALQTPTQSPPSLLLHSLLNLFLYTI